MEKEEISTPMLEKIYDTIKQLKEIDIYFNEELPNRQSKVNEELSDLYHYIQSWRNDTPGDYTDDSLLAQ